jgi:hypothetical protein
MMPEVTILNQRNATKKTIARLHQAPIPEGPADIGDGISHWLTKK